MNIVRQIIGFVALVLVGAILGAGVYESTVLVPNFQNDVPNSLEHFHQFMRVANPGTFFRAIAPATQVSLLLCVILFWKLPSARWWYVVAFAALVMADVVTFTFHYPRNHFLFRAPLTHPVAELARAAQEWGAGNLVRNGLVILTALGAASALRNALLAMAPKKSA